MAGGPGRRSAVAGGPRPAARDHRRDRGVRRHRELRRGGRADRPRDRARARIAGPRGPARPGGPRRDRRTAAALLRRPPGGERADRGGGRHRPARRLHLTRPVAAGARCLRRGRPPVVAGPHPGPAARRDPGAEPHLRQHRRHPRGGPETSPTGRTCRTTAASSSACSTTRPATTRTPPPQGSWRASCSAGRTSRSGRSCGRSDELEKVIGLKDRQLLLLDPFGGRAAARGRGRGRRGHRRPRLGVHAGLHQHGPGQPSWVRRTDGPAAQALDRRADPGSVARSPSPPSPGWGTTHRR